MNEKKKRILEESMKLFSRKGFHATSIQEIVEQSEVSKGAFYLYFSSKDELNTEIIKYYSELVFGQLEKIQQQDMEKRKKLQAQIQVLVDIISEHKEYVMMYPRELVHVGKDIDQLIQDSNKKSFEWMKASLLQLYGDKIEPYIIDGSILLEGLLHGYTKAIVFHNIQIDTAALSEFIVDRLDDMIQNMLHNHVEPQVKWSQLSYPRVKEETNTSINVQDQILLVKKQIKQTNIDEQQKEQLREAVEVIEQEWRKKRTNMVIVRGMLAELAQIESLKKATNQLETLMGI